MNRRLLMLAAGVGIGYVLGTRAGRERYDEMKAKATALWEDPRVAKARRDVEAYARQQAPIIRERAEAAAKAAPGVAKDVAANVSSTAKDVAANVSSTAKDVAANVSSTAKDVAGKASATAKDVAGRVTEAATGAREQAGKVASGLRDRGGAAIDTAVTNAGEARDRALAAIDDDDETPGRLP
jgi:hypothetical protein